MVVDQEKEYIGTPHFQNLITAHSAPQKDLKQIINNLEHCSIIDTVNQRCSQQEGY